jgi:hypothetical protein
MECWQALRVAGEAPAEAGAVGGLCGFGFLGVARDLARGLRCWDWRESRGGRRVRRSQRCSGHVQATAGDEPECRAEGGRGGFFAAFDADFQHLH